MHRDLNAPRHYESEGKNMKTRRQSPLLFLPPAGWISGMVLALALSIALMFAAFPLH
jgi:hypothetical protein